MNDRVKTVQRVDDALGRDDAGRSAGTMLQRLKTTVGRPSIQPFAFLVTKLAIVPPHVFLITWAVRMSLVPSGRIVVGAVLAGIGELLMVVAIRELGGSTRIGMPREATALKTHGLYRFSRNPIYVGLFLAGIGSCLLVPHWFNLLSTAIMIAGHHRIVIAEERFLEGRFGQAWLDYRARVRRYL